MPDFIRTGKGVGRQATLVFFMRICSMGAGILATIVLARHTEKEIFSEFSLFYAVLNISLIVPQHAIAIYLVKLRSLLAGKYHRKNAKGFGVYVTYSFFISLVAIMLYLFDRERASLYLVVALSTLIMGFSIGFRGGILTAVKRPELASPLEAIFRNIIFSILVAAFINQNTADQKFLLYILFLLSALGSLALCIIVDRHEKVLKEYSIPRTFKSYRLEQEDFKLIGTLALIGGVSVLNANIDMLMLGYMGILDGVGDYRIAILINSTLALTYTTASSVISPRMVGGEFSKFARESVFLTRGILGVNLGFLIFWLFWGEQIIVLLVGAEYSQAYLISCILIFGQLLNSFFGFSGLFLSLNGKQNIALVVGFSFLVLNIVANFILIPTYGAVGAAVGTLCIGFMWRLVLMLSMKLLFGRSLTALG